MHILCILQCIYVIYFIYIHGLYIASIPYYLFIAVASRNNDRTVSGKAYAWRLLGMMPGISKAATVAQTSSVNRGVLNLSKF